MRKLTLASFHAAPTISRQPGTGWRLQSASSCSQQVLPPALSLRVTLPGRATLLSSSPRIPVLSDRSTPWFWSKLHPQLSRLIPCPAENNALLSTQMPCCAVPSASSYPHPGWNPGAALPPWRLLYSQSSKFSQSSKHPALCSFRTLLLGWCSLALHIPPSWSLFLCRQRQPQAGTPLPLNFMSAPLAPRVVTSVGFCARAPSPNPKGPASTRQPKPGGLVFTPPPFSHLYNGERRGEGATTQETGGEHSPPDKLQKWLSSIPQPHPHPYQGLTCVGTVSQSRAGVGVPGALRPQLSAGCARPPGSQSLGSAGLAKESRGLRAGVPELPGSAAAISSLRPSLGIRGGLRWEISPSLGLTAAPSHLGGDREDHQAGALLHPAHPQVQLLPL